MDAPPPRTPDARSALLPSLDAVIAAASAGPPVRAAIVDATERSVVEGAVDAALAGIVEPTFVGPEAEVREVVAGVPGAERYPVLDAPDDHAAGDAAVDLVADGRADVLCKGHLHTDVFLHPVLRRLRTRRRLSHVFLCDVPTYPKLLAVTDATVNIFPDLSQKIEIVRNAVDLMTLLGVERPNVAVLSAVETVNPAIPSTIDGASLAVMGARRQVPHAVVEGPLAFDDAISAEASRVKGIATAIAGEIDIALVPDLTAGNILVKALEHLAGATVAGVVLGATVPTVLTSRADPPRCRLASLALAAVVHHRGGAAQQDASTGAVSR
jgi:phosphotransacetylase